MACATLSDKYWLEKYDLAQSPDCFQVVEMSLYHKSCQLSIDDFLAIKKHHLIFPKIVSVSHCKSIKFCIIFLSLFLKQL
jgi:hypothetical protein